MVNLKNLKVSLTKHGAHKVAELLLAYPPNDLLLHLDDSILGIHIDDAQARSNLSIPPSGTLPSYWHEAKQLGSDHVKGLVLLAIVFSHYRLIEALYQSRPRLCTGIVRRGTIVGGKEYTNFACIFEELGFVRNHRQDMFEYDFSQLITLQGFQNLFVRMLHDKLVGAGMITSHNALTEALHNNINIVLGMNASEFSEWWNTAQISPISQIDDILPELPELDDNSDLKFKAGHLLRSTTPIKVSSHLGNITVDPLHNKIQNALYNKLCIDFGQKYVGTEQPVGQARVDVVLKIAADHVFYEIKTVASARSCIRQALAQLLEYSYWPESKRAVKMVVVGRKPLTSAGKKYMKHIRRSFNIPVWYQWYNINSDVFSDEE